MINRLKNKRIGFMNGLTVLMSVSYTIIALPILAVTQAPAQVWAVILLFTTILGGAVVLEQYTAHLARQARYLRG